MFLLDDATAVAQPPANPVLPGTPGYASDGDLAAGQARTTLRAWHYNLMMRELIAVVQQAGIALSATDSTQVYQAIAKLIANAIAGAALGFTPVQQGGVAGQGADKLNLGWDDTNHQLLLAVGGAAVGSIALKADLTAAINAVLGGAPAGLVTLKEIADSINDETNYAAQIIAQLALKANLVAPVFAVDGNGNFPTTPTPGAGDATLKMANMAALQREIAGAVAAIAPRGNVSSGAGPWWEWSPSSGFTRVWGEYTTAVTIEGPIQVNFPVVMDRCDDAWAGPNENSNTGDTTFPRDTKTNSSATFLAQDSQGGNAATATGFFWQAIGYTAAQPPANAGV